MHIILGRSIQQHNSDDVHYFDDDEEESSRTRSGIDHDVSIVSSSHLSEILHQCRTLTY